MANGATVPDGISFITTGSLIDPVSESSNQATSIQTALTNRPYYQYVWAAASNRTGQSGMRAGDLGFEVDTATPYQYISAAAGWQPLPYGVTRMQAGSVSITPAGTASPYTGSSTISFPTNFFSSPPSILANPNTASPQTVNASVSAVTATGATINLDRTDGTYATTVYWMALL